MSALSNIRNSIHVFFARFKKSAGKKGKKVNEKRKVAYQGTMKRVEKRPVLAFLGLLLILFGLILISSTINKPESAAEEISTPVKEVQVYDIGSSPSITVQAVVEKSGVIKIVSLGSGVVSSINVEPGESVGKGTNLIQLSSNYQGGNAPGVQAALAYAQYKNVTETYDSQKEIIAKQRELAEKSDDNSQELRSITNDSIGSSQSLIDLNNNILSSLQAQQDELEETNVGGANDQAILQTKQLKSQFQSANLQLNNSLSNARYQAGDDNIPAEISNLNKEIALKQLDIQEKALDLNKEVSRLNLVLAQIGASIMRPVSPVAGKVERVYVRVGQVVSPGTPLVQIVGNSDSLIAVALLSRETAQAVSRSLVSTLHFGNESFQEVPFYVSEDATDGRLYSAQYAIPEQYSGQITDKGYILIEIPISIPDTGSAIPYVPIDAVFQTQDDSFVFVAQDGKAVSKKVLLGEVIGSYVEVIEGLSEGDQVILNRNIINGDSVKVTN